MTLKYILHHAATQLAEFPTPKLDAEILLSFVLNVSRSYLYSHSDERIDKEKQVIFESLLKRRIQGEPIAYIVGHQEFWSMDFEVTKDVLIPRRETELLVETVFEILPADKKCSVLDLGSGSGAIALAIAKERPHWKISGVDQSEKAIQLARKNQKHLNISNVTFTESNWFSALNKKRFDLIVSNPPYISEQDPHLNQGDIRFEPKEALISGKDGLDDILKISAEAIKHLKSNGYLIFEHGYNQSEAVKKILQKNQFMLIEARKDLSGIDRITFGKRK